MNKVLMFSAVVLILLAGCSSKEPAIDETQSAQAAPVESAADADTVVVDDNGGVVATDTGVESGEMTMSALEKEMQTIYFDFDKYDISAVAADKLQANVVLAEGKASAYNIKIEGNCDEWGSDEYNFALGLKRAKAAKDAMVADGIAENRITMVSYGESNPVCVEKTNACWAQNRRADFKLLP